MSEKAAHFAQQRQHLLDLLRQEPRGIDKRQNNYLLSLIGELESACPTNLAVPESLDLLEGVWELRWSSSTKPYLAVGPWLENLQLLSPSRGRGMNLLRLPGKLASLAGVAVAAAINVDIAPVDGPLQRVQVNFKKGGWLGPSIGGKRLQLMREINQSFPAWLDITYLDSDLRLCHGNGGTIFALLRRSDLSIEELLQS